MTGSKAALIVVVPLPTTLIFANVLAEINGLNNQNIQVMNVGTLMKNFLDCEGMRVGICTENPGYLLRIRGSSPGRSWKLGRPPPLNWHHDFRSQHPRSLLARREKVGGDKQRKRTSYHEPEP